MGSGAVFKRQGPAFAVEITAPVPNRIGSWLSAQEGLIPSPLQTYEKVRCVFSGLVRAIYRIEVVGAGRLPATGPAVVAPNHESVLDPIILGAAISRKLRFVAKAELWRSQLFAWMLDGLGAIPIERGRSDYHAAALVLKALEAGQAVVIFPQGAVRGDREWKHGAAHAALLTGAPLVPVRLVGTARALARGRIGFPRLRVIVGKPIDVVCDPEDPGAAAKLTERLRVAVEALA
jgi:1-acyl-sn-glycerol-3-phosphate acyltransferase